MPFGNRADTSTGYKCLQQTDIETIPDADNTFPPPGELEGGGVEGDAAPFLVVGSLGSPMPTQSFHAASVAPVAITQAWHALQRAETWEGIAGVEAVHDAVHDGQGHLTEFGFAVSVGGVRYSGSATVVLSVHPTHIRLDLTTSEVIATIDVRLHADDQPGATRVNVELTVRSRSFLAGMFFPAIADTIGRGLPTTTAQFAERLAV